MLFTRTSNKKYVVGFDLGETGSQVSWSESGAEPVTFAQKEKGGSGENLYIPTVLSKKFGANIWFCGQEAETRASHGDGTIVRHILSSALQGRAILIEGQEYDPCSLLALYVRRVLALMADTVPTSEISVLLFTMETIDQNTVEMLGRASSTSRSMGCTGRTIKARSIPSCSVRTRRCMSAMCCCASGTERAP